MLGRSARKLSEKRFGLEITEQELKEAVAEEKKAHNVDSSAWESAS